MYKLVISDDEGKTTVVPLIREEITIGRKEGNTIRLTDRNVSRYHARVIRQDEDFVIEDLGSLCGTNVNNEVLHSHTHIIAAGDNISIGDYSLSIRSDVGSEVPMGRQMEPGDQAGIGKVTPHARLVMLSAPAVGKEVDLTAELYVIGRSEEANFHIDHPSISRAHARIDLESGKWTISDLDSGSGIHINGFKKDDYVLKAGDIILLGSVEFRFVAPGEPYDYPHPDKKRKKEEKPAVEARYPEKSSRMLYIAIGGAALAVGAVIAIVVALIGPGEKAGEAQSKQDDIVTFESLLEQGKDKMQEEEWGEAARLFALAQQKNPDSTVARELKTLAIKESDAQTVFKTGLAAQENRNWTEAIANFSQIPRSSHYYDPEQLKIVAGKLCDELIEKASFIEKTGSKSDLDGVILEIFQIPEAPQRCRGPKGKLLDRIRIHTLSGRDGGLNEGERDIPSESQRSRGHGRDKDKDKDKDRQSSRKHRASSESNVQWDGQSPKRPTRKPSSEKQKTNNPYKQFSNPYRQ